MWEEEGNSPMGLAWRDRAQEPSQEEFLLRLDLKSDGSGFVEPRASHP